MGARKGAGLRGAGRAAERASAAALPPPEPSARLSRFRVWRGRDHVVRKGRGDGGYHDDGRAARVRLLAPLLAGGGAGVCIRGAGGRREVVRVASRSALGHLSEVGTEQEVTGVGGRGARPLGTCFCLYFVPSWRKQIPSLLCKALQRPLWIPGLSELESSLQDFFPLA